MPPPHLPPKTTDTSWRDHFLFARATVLVLIIGLVAGATAALGILAWYPEIIGGAPPSFVSYRIPVQSPRNTLVPDQNVFAQNMKNASVMLYPASALVRSLGAAWYPKDAATGGGVILTDDGWVLTTKTAAHASADIRIIDARGVVYTIEKEIQDLGTGFSFIKIKGNGFSVVPVAGDEIPNMGDSLLHVGGAGIVAHTVGAAVYNRSEPLFSDKVTRVFSLIDAADVAEGTPLFSDQGVLIGIARRDTGATVIVPVAGMNSWLSNLLSGSAFPAPTVRISYIMMPDVVPDSLGKDPQAPRTGAYVVSALRNGSYKGALPSLLQGDIITAVNDTPLTAHEDLALLLAKKRTARNVLLTVYRSGEQMRVPLALMGISVPLDF